MEIIIPTEEQNLESRELDSKSIAEILELMTKEDFNVVSAVRAAHPQIQQLISAIISTFNNHGRLFYVGAGTSGRLGVLDASECPPTFSVSPEMVQGIIAGGIDALTRAVEGAEDNAEAGSKAIATYDIKKTDLLLGISASGLAPFVLAALKTAKQIGAKVWLLTCNNQLTNNKLYSQRFDGVISVNTGPEIITGSTRLKAGTATKMILNMLTTIAMIKLGKVYGNLMVDVNPTNAKLKNRACRIIAKITGCDFDQAEMLLTQSGNQPKVAIVMHLKNVDKNSAEQLLTAKKGFLREVI